jgi:AraC-like DNA-binding protein
MVHAGLTTDIEREIETLYMTQQASGQDPAARAILASGDAAALRRELVTDRSWYGSPFVGEHRRRWRLDDSIYGAFPRASGMIGIGCFRAWGARPFDDIDCALVDLFFRQCKGVVFGSHDPARPPPARAEAPGRRACLEDFVRSPVGRFVAGRTFAHFCASPEFFGTILVGVPDVTDMRALAQAHDADVRCGARHLSIFDASRLEAVTADAYEAINAAWFERQTALNRLTERQAIVLPGGMAGATLTGYRRFSPLRFPTRVFDKPGPALAWLGQPHLEGPLRSIAAELAEEGASLRAVRAHLFASPTSTLAQVSRSLGMSDRSLQRQLTGAGTSFRIEAIQARIEAAKKLLAETDLKLSAIALDVGCASSQHFSVQFRRVTGSTPSAWRVRARGRGV